MTEAPTSATSMWTSEPHQWPGSIFDRCSAAGDGRALHNLTMPFTMRR
jgi:hypothetical protein